MVRVDNEDVLKTDRGYGERIPRVLEAAVVYTVKDSLYGM